MNTPTDSIDSSEFARFATQPAAHPTIDPDDPPWGLASALFVWLAALLTLLLLPALVVLIFLFIKNPALSREQFLRAVTSDPTAILIQVAAIFPAHLLTLGIAWAVVTRFGKRPFWKHLGWSWSENFGFWSSAGLAVLMLIVGGILKTFYEGDETSMDQLIASSNATRFTVAFLAAATAPLVEEIVYRGVLYPAAQRVIGMFWAVIAVALIFSLPHADQYKQNFVVFAAVAIFGLMLTIVRARTKRLLPCFVMHAVFNGIQAIVLVLDPFINKANQTGGKQMGAIFYTSLSRFLN